MTDRDEAPRFFDVHRRVGLPVDRGPSRPETGSFESTPADLGVPTRNFLRGRERSGAETISRYEYQYECAALILLRDIGLDDSDIVELVLEGPTDIVVISRSSVPRLVSVKHREANQSGEGGWTYSALKKAKAFQRLFNAWTDLNERCSVSFYSNSGFQGSASRLSEAAISRRVLATSDPIIEELGTHLEVDAGTALRFFEHLVLPEQTLPHRDHISAVGRDYTAKYLRSVHAELQGAAAAYDALCRLIQRRSGDHADSYGPIPMSLEHLDERQQARFSGLTVTLDEVKTLLVSTAQDLTTPTSRPKQIVAPDPAFIGRESLLETISQHLSTQEPMSPVRPVVLYGSHGTGKSALAWQFAALHNDRFHRILRVDGSSRQKLVDDLQEVLSVAFAQDGQNQEPVYEVTAGTDTIVIVEDVQDGAVVEGIIPTVSNMRVIMTSNVDSLNLTYTYVKVEEWDLSETLEYGAKVWPAAKDSDLVALGQALGNLPLAVAQGIALCQRLRWTVSDFLQALTTGPTQVLDLGRAPGSYKLNQTTLKVLRMSLDELQAEAPLARDLIDIASVMGDNPIPISLIFGDHELTAILDPQLNVRHRFRKVRPLKASEAMLSQLSEPRASTAVLEVLFRRCLVSSSANAKEVAFHPLQLRIARALLTNRRLHVEIVCSLFAAPLLQRATYRGDLLQRYDRQILNTLKFAEESDVHGNALLALADSVAVPLAMSGRREGALQAAEYALSEVDFLPDNALNKESLRVRQLFTLAMVHSALGHADAAIDMAVQAWHSSSALDATWQFSSLMRVGQVAISVEAPELAQFAIDRLPLPSTLENRSFDLNSVEYSVLRGSLCLFLGDIDGLRLHVSWLLKYEDRLEEDHRLQLYRLASALSYHSGDAEEGLAFVEKQMQALPNVLKHSTDENLLQLRLLLDHAHRLMDLHRPMEAQASVMRAEEIVRTTFDGRQDLQCEVWATKGRMLHGLMSASSPRSMRVAAECLVAARDGFLSLLNNTSRRSAMLPDVLYHLSDVYLRNGQGTKALEAINQAIALDSQYYGPEHPEVQKDQLQLRKITSHLAEARQKNWESLRRH